MPTEQRYYKGAEVWEEGRSWQFRVLLAAIMADPMGLIVRAVLGANSSKGHALGLEATIRRDGMVVTKLRGPAGEVLSEAHPVGDIVSLRDEFRRLADHCKLDDDQRLELFDMFKKWCGRDLRAITPDSTIGGLITGSYH